MALDPKRTQFRMSAPRPLLDDPEEKGLNCDGCLFQRQRAAVCIEASAEAVRRGLRDCDAIDQFGEVVIYLRTEVDPRQQDLLEGA